LKIFLKKILFIAALRGEVISNRGRYGTARVVVAQRPEPMPFSIHTLIGG